jgi:hypothetical protein
LVELISVASALYFHHQLLFSLLSRSPIKAGERLYGK